VTAVSRLVSAALAATRMTATIAVGFHAGVCAAVDAGGQAWRSSARTGVQDAVAPARPGAALLVDLDNLGIRKARLGETLAALRNAAGDVPALAGGHPTVVREEVRQICNSSS
jgi:hypothetical protein